MFKQFLRYCLIKLDSNLPNLLPVIELELQKAQGVSWLSSSIEFEVQTAFGFLPDSVKLNLCCLDVGANVGKYSRAILDECPNAEIHLFEPHPHSIQNLVKNFSSDSNVLIHELALGSETTKQSLFFDEPGSGLSSLYQRQNLPNGVALNKSVSVNVSTVDIECQRLGLKPSFIKIDTEGNELAVLKGAIDTILRFKPVIQFEFGGSSIDSRTFFVDYWDFFNTIGYSVYRITPSGTKLIAQYSERNEVFSHMNFIAKKTDAKSSST